MWHVIAVLVYKKLVNYLFNFEKLQTSRQKNRLMKSATRLFALMCTCKYFFSDSVCRTVCLVSGVFRILLSQLTSYTP